MWCTAALAQPSKRLGESRIRKIHLQIRRRSRTVGTHARITSERQPKERPRRESGQKDASEVHKTKLQRTRSVMLGVVRDAEHSLCRCQKPVEDGKITLESGNGRPSQDTPTLRPSWSCSRVLPGARIGRNSARGSTQMCSSA